MLRYKKNVWCLCVLVFAFIGISCKDEAPQSMGQTCSVNNHAAAMTSENPVKTVILDDKAKAALTKQKVTAVYCVAMGAS